MARSLNKIAIIGHLGKDPEIRYMTSGKACATFSVATSESWKGDDGEQKEQTQWHRVVAWGKLAEIIGEYLTKGSKVYIDGKMQYRTYDDKNGVKHNVAEIVADNLIMLDGKPRQSAQSSDESTPPRANDEGDLPF